MATRKKCTSTRASGWTTTPACWCTTGPCPKDSNATAGAKNSYDRATAQYQDDIRRDYITGVYNTRYIQEEYRSYAEKQATQGNPVGAVMLRVNEYWKLRNKESQQAAECCLNTAAGILQLAVGTDQEHAVLARLEDGLFAAITVGMPAARLAQTINKALEAARKVFSITLARRGHLHGDHRQRRMGRDFLLGNDALPGPAAAVKRCIKPTPLCTY